MKFQRLALIGCGLMGGSFALALRQAGLVAHVAGFSASENTRQKAVRLGVIDTACASAAEAAEGADLVLIAVPVRATEATLRAIDAVLSSNALVMDVGSTKGDVVTAARTALRRSLPNLVPAHPIAGKEVAGIEHADAALYRDRLVILTPLPETPTERVLQAHQLWQAVGSRVLELSAQAHDASFAAVSHLPHLAAFALVNAVARQPHGAQHLSMAGPGFRDFSRIAASDPCVWRDILLANRDEVLHQCTLMREVLHEFETAMRGGDAEQLQTLISEASQTRSRWRLGGADSDV
ncbi:MAG: prephenate dehydrogenase [Limnohabitans sp.]